MTRIDLTDSGGAIGREYLALRTLERCTAQAETFDAGAYDARAVQRLRELWGVRMSSEYVSAAVFLRLAVQLLEGGATLDQQAVMTRMALDETRHAEVCGRFLITVGAEGACEVPETTPPLAVYPGIALPERALRNVLYACCLIESVNVARFVATLDGTLDPCVREATRQLLSDEVQHASFGFDYLQAWSPWLERHGEARAGLEAFLRPAFADVEQRMSLGGVKAEPLTADERALGIPDVASFRDIFYQTMEHAIVPGLERLGLAAADAYRHRSMDGWV